MWCGIVCSIVCSVVCGVIIRSNGYFRTRANTDNIGRYKQLKIGGGVGLGRAGGLLI